MSLTLRDASTGLQLREQAVSPRQLGLFADQLEANDTNPISRGWNASSEGMRGSELLAEANAAERAGDVGLSQALQQQAMDHMQRAQVWAPTTQDFTDIRSAGDLGNWAGGGFGSAARSMIAPLAGGVAGRVVGGLAGGLIGGPVGAAVGANLGGVGGAFIPGYDSQYNESVGQSMMDPEIRAKRSAEEIYRTGQKVGAAQGLLESIVPAGVAKIGLGGLGKRTIGGVIARESGEEFLTEGAQSYVGQTGQNQLAGRNLTDYDHLEAFNAAMAGAVGGGGIGAGGAAVGAVRDKLASGAGKVVDVARDPLGAVIQKGYDLAEKAGKKKAQKEIAEGNTPIYKMFEEARSTANDERIFDAPKPDETDEMVTARMREDADRWADRILSSQPRAFGPREEELRNAAAQYKSDRDWSKLRSVLRKNKLSEERESMMSSFEPEGAKASEMTPEGQELDALSSAWLKNEGKRYGEYFSDGSDEANGLGAKLFAWIKNDFGAKMTDDDGEIFIPRAFIEALGDRAPGVVESAITAARKEGWDIKNAGDAVATIREYVNSNEGDTSFLTSAIRYSQQENWTPKMIQRFAKELRQKGGRLDKDDYRWLKTQVGDIAGVLEHFQKPSRFYKAENKLKTPSTKDELQNDLGLEVANGGDTDSGSDITENDGDWNSGVNTFSAPKSTINVLGTYDISDPDQLTEMKSAEGDEMGIVDHARSTLSGAPLARRLRELTNEYDAPLAEINRRVRMKVDIKDEAQSTSIGPEHVEKLRVSPDAFNSATKKRDPIDGKDRGVLFVEVRDGDPFVTSSAKLINTVRQDKDTESSQYGVAEAEDRMLQGLGQLMAAMPEAGMIPTGRVGYKNEAGGSITWLRKVGSKMRSRAGGQGALLFGPSPKIQGVVHPLNLPDDFNFIEKSKAEGYSRANARAQRQSRFKQSVDTETDLNMRDLKDVTVSELETLWGDIADKGLGLLTAKEIATKKLEKNATNLTKAFNQAKKRGDMKRIAELNKQLTAAEAGLQKAKEPLQRAMDTLRDQLNTIRDEIESRTQITSGIKYVTDDFGTQRLVKRGKERVPGERKLAANVSEKNTGDTLTKETNDETKNSDGGIYGSRRLAEAAAKPGERVRKFARGRWLIERKTGGIETTSRVVSPTETEEFAQNAKEKEIKRDLATGYEITTEPTDVEGWWKGENGPWKDLPLPTTNLNVPDIVKARVHALLKKGVPTANFAIGNMRLDALTRMAEMLRTKFWHDMPQYEGDSLVAIDRLGDFKGKKSVREKVAAKRAEANKRLAARKKIDERAEMMLDKIQSRLNEIADESGEVLGGNKRPRRTEGEGVQASDSRVSSADGQRAEADTQVAGKRGGSDAKVDGGRGAATVPNNGVTAKQDAWVMKFASMSKKDMRDFVASLPSEKLGKVFAALNVFHPADNSNPFWQRNNLDNYTDAKSEAVFEAQELIRDRLDAEDAKYSMMSTEIHNDLGKDGFAATHDSPIRHEGKFNWREHKGKGEGNASFGAGTYLSTADGVHKSYKKQFTAQVSAEGSFTWNGDLYELDYEAAGVIYKNGYAEMSPAEEAVAYAILIEGRPAEEAISAAIDDAFFNVDRTASEVADLISVSDVDVSAKDLSYVLKAFRERVHMDSASVAQPLTKFFDVGRWNRMVASADKKASDLRKMDSSGIVVNQKNISPTYHVTVNIKPEQLLDWDAPLSEQSEFVKNTLRGIKEARPATVQDMFTGEVVESVEVSGKTIYNNIKRSLGSQAAASDYLQSLGILGHKYAASGGKNDKHPNYVIYDDSKIETNYVHFSKQTTSDFKQLDPEQALADISRMLGKDFDAKVVKKLGGKAGTWTPGIIRMATSAADGTQFHEALHELFNQMRTHGAANVAQIIERVANSPLILRKLEQLLSDHPKAIKQLKTPEEAAAYLFQFWNMGLINVGPETKSLFQTIKDLIVDVAKELHSWINAAKREERKAEKAQKMDEAEVRRLFEALAGGGAATSDVNVRQALYDGLRKNIEAHTKEVDKIGQRVEGFWQGLGRVVVTSESMLNLYSKHPELKTIADKFHQMAGKLMKNQARNSSLMARGGLIEAKHAEVQRRLNPFERFLMEGKYDDKDMSLAAKHLEANTLSADKKINALIDYVHKYYGEMYDYMVQSDVRRLDPTSEERWVPIQKRKDYFTQSWSIEELTKDHDGFVTTLLDKHAKELGYMAQQANAEIAAWNKDSKTELTSPTAKALRDKQDAEFEASGNVVAKSQPLPNVTPEMIAEQIYVRLLNSTGMIDIQETSWSLGLTPAAGAVNRRELDWLDKEAFSKYKSKDLVEIVTNYTRTMVARAEYQKRFGYGGEVIAEAMDTSFLREIGGQELVDKAVASLPEEIKTWKKSASKWHKDNPGVPYHEPYPTLRLVGVQAHRAQVGDEASNKAMIAAEKTLRPAVNAVRALEGTLGNEISPAMRSVNSWINTYQNVRLLPLSLFTNFSDVIGITVNGGTLGDAWNAFTAGMREVRNTWVNEKGSDSATLRAEEWGVSDAGAMLDTLGQNYGSVYMNEKARNINNKFFRVIGMEGWNRGVRITATAVGERIITDWVKNGVDTKKAGEKARFERLFGEGVDAKKIKLDSAGNLDTQDAANRAAIQRFVQDSVMSSNSAVRAIWMSDPRMATFAHLKNFAYAFHSVMLKGILAQASQGNLRPALVASLGFASISIAAGAIKEMLIPGDEPYWMKGGLDNYLEYGLDRANLGGVPQMYLESVTDFDPAKLAGPFWDQIQDTLSSPIPGLTINPNLSPFGGSTEIEILRDRKVAVELAKALPAGNLAGRGMESLVGE